MFFIRENEITFVLMKLHAMLEEKKRKGARNLKNKDQIIINPNEI